MAVYRDRVTGHEQEAVFWNGSQITGRPIPWWIGEGMRQGASPIGGGILRVGNEIHLFPPGKPPTPETALVTLADNYILWMPDSEALWGSCDPSSFEARYDYLKDSQSVRARGDSLVDIVRRRTPGLS